MAIISGKKIDPNSGEMEMTRCHTDDKGKTWEKGTRYYPYSAGMAGGFEYQEITIKDKDVIFTNNNHKETNL